MAYQKCKWLDVKGRFTVNDVAQCKWPQPEAVLPVSITTSHGYQEKHPRRWISKADCKKCPCFDVDNDQ